MYDKLKIEAYQNFGGINLKDSHYKTEITQFLDLRNYCFEKLGNLVSRPGTESHLTLPVSTYINKPYNTYQYIKEDGSSYILFDSGQTLHSFGASLKAIDGELTGSPTTSTQIDFVTAKDVCYFAEGDLKKYDGVSVLKVSVSDIDPTNPNSVSFNTGLGGVTATIPVDDYYFRAAWLRGTPSTAVLKVNELFTVPPFKEISQIGTGAEEGLSLLSIGSTIQSDGKWLLWGLTAPTNEGVSSVAVAYSRVATGITNFFYSLPQAFFQTTISGVTTWATEFDHFTASQATYTARPPVIEGVERLAFFNNMLVGANNDILSFSTLDDIEAFPPENQVNLFNNQEDRIIAMVPFQDALVVFKEDSIHEITGDSPETLSVVDVTYDYGCVSSKGFCVFRNRLFFADRKGIAEYAGTNTRIISTYIEPQMDTVDKTKLAGLHVKKHNQVWFGDGSILYVYDYIANAWTFYDVLPIDSEAGFFNYTFSDSRTDAFYWEEGASFHQGIRFGESLFSDQGSDITLVFKTKFHSRLGESTQELWRRFFVNSETSVTLSATLNAYPNYGSDVSLSRSLDISQFQERIDFGVSAKSLSVELIASASTKVVINGYTIESRYLRQV